MSADSKRHPSPLMNPEEYADAQHMARRGGHFAPRDASLIARALLYADARIAQLEDAGGEFLRAYLDASVNDEEGLLAALDAREWTAMWVSVDDKAQAFGHCLSASNQIDRKSQKTWGQERTASPETCPDCGHDAHTPRYCVMHDCACGEPSPAKKPSDD